MKTKILLLLNRSANIFVQKPIGFRKLSQFLVMQNSTLVHREVLKG